jgi:hypothetical protein
MFLITLFFHHHHHHIFFSFSFFYFDHKHIWSTTRSSKIRRRFFQKSSFQTTSWWCGWLPKKRGLAKTRWLRGIAAHLQLNVVQATSDAAKAEKRTWKISLSNGAIVKPIENIGIENNWVSVSDLVQLLVVSE